MEFRDHRRLIPVSDPKTLAEMAAQILLRQMAANDRGIAICLTGGATPKRLYALLATAAYQSRIPWDRVHWFVSDERFVRPGDPLHNMSMARQALLDRYAPPGNIHPIPTETSTPDESARRYERELKLFYGADRPDPAKPLFDVVLAGMGPDGHTASLFPGDPAVEERERWVVGIGKANVEPFVPRVTLTLPVLGACRQMLFEVAGADKRASLTRVLDGENLPAGRARSTGETIWLVDREALPEDSGG